MDDKCILNFREINKNGNIGVSIPKKITNLFNISEGRFKTKIKKEDEKLILEIELKDILSDWTTCENSQRTG